MRIAETKLKKQSQFTGKIIGLKSYLKRDYSNMPAFEVQKTKPISGKVKSKTAKGKRIKLFEKTNPIYFILLNRCSFVLISG